MPRRARTYSESGVYHVMVRGVNRAAIFLEDADCERFLLCLDRTKVASGCEVLAFCLMGNHVHLLVRAAGEGIGDVVKRLGVRYVGWFNHKYGRVGHLFQNRFLSLPVDDDVYLLALVRYIWANPVKAGLVATPEHYRWNSCWQGGHPVGLIDEQVLDGLMPHCSRLALVKPIKHLELAAVRTGRPPAHTADQVSTMLTDCCGTSDPAEFALLGHVTRLRTIRELRSRSVSYASIAEATGMSITAVRRLQVAG